MLYLDTSLLVTSLTIERETARVQEWLASQSEERMSISDWTITEFSSALSLKIRTKQLTLEEQTRSLANFNRLVFDAIEVLPLGSPHFRLAARFVEQSTLGLRSGDALHVAIAFEQGARLCTRDRRLAAAALALGADVALI